MGLRGWRRRYKKAKVERRRKKISGDYGARIARIRNKGVGREIKNSCKGVDEHKQYEEPEWRRKQREREVDQSQDI